MSNTDLETKYRVQLAKALRHLNYSFHKVSKLPKKIQDADEETLETWESFCARFARVIDLFLTKYIKLIVKKSDPAFDGSLLDYLNAAEKIKLISDAKRWLAMRELRNIQAHDYTEDDLEKFLTAISYETEFALQQLKDFA